MTTWTVIRFLHFVGLIFFVGGQLLLATVVAPALRRNGNEEAMRSVAMRFGIGSIIALALAVATGVAMASHYDLWSSSILRAKLMVLVLVGVLLGLHIATPRSRAVSLATLAASLLVVWLGIKLTHRYG